jgi:hypothetical protein
VFAAERSTVPVLLSKIVSLDPQSLPATRAASAASETAKLAKSFYSLRIAIADEKTNAANHIARAADSYFGGSILQLLNYLKSLVDAQGLEPWIR